MTWRVARSLLVLRDQINARAPGRSKASDGTIGDTAHANQGSDSDHNPWYRPVGDPDGIVTAFDCTHDPAHGCDIDELTDELQATRDPRIKYIIANRLIMSGAAGPSPWVWRTYGGADPHTNHFHISVIASPACDDARPWAIGGSAPKPEVPDMDAEQNRRLVNLEEREFQIHAVDADELTYFKPASQGGTVGRTPNRFKLQHREIMAEVAKLQTANAAQAAQIAAIREDLAKLTVGGVDEARIAAMVASKLGELVFKAERSA